MSDPTADRDGIFAAARELLAGAPRILVLTGAGLSRESGLATFRDPDGHWRRHRPEDLATPEAFARDPELVWSWYSERRGRALAAAPHAGHHALAEWAAARGDAVTLLTQNVDGLLERAGARDVVRLHGSLFRVRCAAGCPGEWEDERTPFPHPDPCARCGAPLRPAVTWFGETLDETAISRALEAAETAEVALLVGTSARVTPAAAFAARVAERGGAVIEVNPEASALADAVTHPLRGACGALLPRLLAA